MSIGWKVVNQSAPGTSHTLSGDACQDAEAVSTCNDAEGGQYLVLACADGAGSAKFAGRGSREACRIALELVAGDIRESTTNEPDRWTVAAQKWVSGVQAAIAGMAAIAESTPREFACTFLLAMLGPSNSVFVQVGDGAIVIGDGANFDVVFWPERGEYANQTFFISDENAVERAMIKVGGRVDEVALLTDGLQSLALNYKNKSAHEPFFLSRFRTLRAAEDASSLQVPLRR